MKELKRRSEVVENTIEAFALRACGCGCGCDCGCDCSNTFPQITTRNNTQSTFGVSGLVGPQTKVA